ncbi:MAG: hypothetical protein M5R36_27910 [Deltaproteobacteria bacterium]|nr:hypothetical protein [Deltaproteobacteria bacterium]
MILRKSRLSAAILALAVLAVCSPAGAGTISINSTMGSKIVPAKASFDVTLKNAGAHPAEGLTMALVLGETRRETSVDSLLAGAEASVSFEVDPPPDQKNFEIVVTNGGPAAAQKLQARVSAAGQDFEGAAWAEIKPGKRRATFSRTARRRPGPDSKSAFQMTGTSRPSTCAFMWTWKACS